MSWFLECSLVRTTNILRTLVGLTLYKRKHRLKSRYKSANTLSAFIKNVEIEPLSLGSQISAKLSSPVFVPEHG